MQIATTQFRAVPLAIGAFFACVTARVLFDDVLTGAGTWHELVTPKHLLSLAALVATLAAGHMVLAAFRAREIVTGLSLTLLFVAATGYVVLMSGARNAEVDAAKAATARTHASQREAAQTAVTTAQRDLTNAETYAVIKRDEAAACALRGKGNPCAGANETRDSAAELVRLRKIDVRTAKRDLDSIKPAPAVNAGYAHMSRVLSAMGLGDAKTIEARVTLILPFAVVLITELSTVVFLGMGIAHRPRPTLALPAQAATVTPLVAEPAPLPAPTQQPMAIIEHPVLAALRNAGRPLCNDELARAMGVTKGEASKRRAEVAGLIRTRQVGRFVMIEAV